MVAFGITAALWLPFVTKNSTYCSTIHAYVLPLRLSAHHCAPPSGPFWAQGTWLGRSACRGIFTRGRTRVVLSRVDAVSGLQLLSRIPPVQNHFRTDVTGEVSLNAVYAGEAARTSWPQRLHLACLMSGRSGSTSDQERLSMSKDA